MEGLASSCPLSSPQSAPFLQTASCPVDQRIGDRGPLSPYHLMPTDLEAPPGFSTLRVTSSIPRSGVAGSDADMDANASHWQYPSPAMFYAAVARKGHTEALAALKESPADLEAIVHIHNVVNEKAWREILAYEKHHSIPCASASAPSAESASELGSHLGAHAGRSGPKLKRFVGRPGELSPKARILSSLFGYQRPFDRHDWYVEREDGTTVRYIIDFYSGRPKLLPSSASDTTPPISVPSIYLDVRPELSLEGLVDRVRMKLASLF